MRNGHGQEVTSHGKYNGEWFEDLRHGRGISIDNNGDMYEGQFRLNKRHGEGTLTRLRQVTKEEVEGE